MNDHEPVAYQENEEIEQGHVWVRKGRSSCEQYPGRFRGKLVNGDARFILLNRLNKIMGGFTCTASLNEEAIVFTIKNIDEKISNLCFPPPIKSFVEVPDARINNYYWIQQYTTCSSMRSNLQIMDLMGAWYSHTLWQGIWRNLSTQFMYGHLLSSNNLEAALPRGEALDEHEAAMIQNVPEKYRYNSAGLGRASSFNLLSEVNPDDSVAPCYNRETGNLTWAMHNYYLYYRYSMDDSLLLYKIYPLLNTWKDILANLIDYPVNETGFMIGKDVALETAHRHFSSMMMIYPFGIFSAFSKANETLIRKSINYWTTLSGNDRSVWSYSWAAGAYAYLQDGKEAYKNLQSFFKYSKRKNYYDLPGIGDNTMHREVGMCAETPFSFVKSLNEMLLQSHNGVVKIFPAMPAAWQEALFVNQRTEVAFLIAALRKNGQTNFFSAESLIGGQCFIKSDIAVGSLQSTSNNRISKTSAFVFSLNRTKGEKVSFYRKGNKDSSDGHIARS